MHELQTQCAHHAKRMDKPQEAFHQQWSDYLSRLELPDFPKKSDKPKPPLILPRLTQDDSLEASITVKLQSLRALVDEKTKHVLCEFAKDVQLSLDSLLRCFTNFLSSPDKEGLDIQKLESIFSNIQGSFKEKYGEFFGTQPAPVDDVFFSLKDTLEELRQESVRLGERLESLKGLPDVSTLSGTTANTAHSADTIPSAGVASYKVEEPVKTEKPKKDDGKGSAGAGLITKLTGFFKRDESYAKTDLGKDSSGMKWDPIKKK